MESIIRKVDTDKIEKLTLIGGFIFTIISGGYYISNYVYNQTYKQNSEVYYGIPSKYFQGSIEDKVFYLSLLIILIGIIFSSLVCKKFIKNRTDIFTNILIACMAVIMGFVFSFLNIKNMYDIMKSIENNKVAIFVNNHGLEVSILIIICSLIGIIGITYIDEIESKLNDRCKKYFDTFIMVILSLFFIMLIKAINVKFSYSNVENKRIYETTIYEDKNMAILSDLDDKVLIAEYEINENKETMLKTYNYMIVDKENLVISYKDLGEKIIVVKE